MGMGNKELNERMKLTNYIMNNKSVLEEWSGKTFNRVLYDSDNDDKKASTFREKIMNHGQLYFIVFDYNNNVFGHYYPGVINKTERLFSDVDTFIFTVNSNGRCGMKKFNSKGKSTWTFIYDGEDYGYYSFGCKNEVRYEALNFKEKSRIFGYGMVELFEGVGKDTLTGSNDHEYSVRKLLIIEMK